MTVLDTVKAAITPEDRAANIETAANMANAVTAIYGISGSGKSLLADTAAEYCWEAFRGTTLCYVADLGGFGTKRLSLIHAGIMKVWDPRNHVDAFATMELMSLGAWPAEIQDPERGYAAPDVPLVLPRRTVFTITCPNGHEVATFNSAVLLHGSQTVCPTCGLITSPANCQKIEQKIVRHRQFESVKLRIYDSLTAMNDYGMGDLQSQSANNKLPTSGSGGSVLGGADALRSGEFNFSTGSKAQYGFLQNRTYGWLSNIKTIPDQVVPAICTFLVEASKTDEDSGGIPVYGPKIAGSARTAAVASWVGNLLHASKEPLDATSKDEQGMPVLVHRLWLTNHIDPRDVTRTPYMAKHRGLPLGMPEYLQDAWDTDATTRKANALTEFSLKRFFTLLDTQLRVADAENRVKYPDAPGWQASTQDGTGDEVLGVVERPGVTGGSQPAPATTITGPNRTLRRPAGRPAASPLPSVATAQVSAATPAAATEAAAGGSVVAGGVVPVEPVPSEAAKVPSSAGAGPAAAPSPIVQQLQASLAARPSTATGPRPLRRVARPPV